MLELGQSNSLVLSVAGSAAADRGQFDEALERIFTAPESLERTQGLALVYRAPETTADSDAAMRELASLSAVDAAQNLAEAHAFCGNTDESFHWLSVARDRARVGVSDGQERELMHELRLSRFFKPLHDDPRWRALVPASR